MQGESPALQAVSTHTCPFKERITQPLVTNAHAVKSLRAAPHRRSDRPLDYNLRVDDSVGARMSTVGGSKGTLNCVSAWIEKKPRPGVLSGWDWRPGWAIGKRSPIADLRMGC